MEFVNFDTFEVRGAKVPEVLHDRTLLVGAAFGFSKSDIGKSAIALLSVEWGNWQVLGVIGQLQAFINLEGRHPEFRYSLSHELWDSLGALPLAYSASELTIAALVLWTDRHKGFYENWRKEKCDRFNVTPEEFEQKIFDTWLLRGRKTRLEVSEERGAITLRDASASVNDEKLS